MIGVCCEPHLGSVLLIVARIAEHFEFKKLSIQPAFTINLVMHLEHAILGSAPLADVTGFLELGLSQILPMIRLQVVLVSLDANKPGLALFSVDYHGRA